MKWFLLWATCCVAMGQNTLVIGSKLHTESHLLGEVLAQMTEVKSPLRVERKFRLGGTRLIFEALLAGEIDVYPEYTGTLAQVLLQDASLDLAGMRKALLSQGIVMTQPMGFNNTYALALREADAEALGIRKISDLATTNALTWGLTHEFLSREDGFPGLLRHYGLDSPKVIGIDKSLQYHALQEGEVAVIDAYSTDGRLVRYPIRVLEDDWRYFPEYLAVWLVREDTWDRLPQLQGLVRRFAGTWDDAAMRLWNAEVDEKKRSVEAVAGEILERDFAMSLRQPHAKDVGWNRIAEKTLRHLELTGLALVFCILMGVPLGMALVGKRFLAEPVLGAVGLLQTIPGLALLAFMIPAFGIGFWPAVFALFLYGLLPIVRNTYSGLAETPPAMVQAARGLGLTDFQILRLVRFPLAIRIILSGIRTSAVISIGTATLAAFIGAGGLGDFILTGLSLNDTGIILRGAIPAAGLAIFVDRILALVEHFASPRGIRKARMGKQR